MSVVGLGVSSNFHVSQISTYQRTTDSSCPDDIANRHNSEMHTDRDKVVNSGLQPSDDSLEVYDIVVLVVDCFDDAL